MRSWLDPYFAVPETPPFPFGRSPFRQRGSVYLSNFEFWEKVVPGGVAAVRAQVNDPAMDRFLAQRFVSSDFYDALPSAFLSVAAARVRKVPIYSHLREHGIFLAERSFSGFSSVVLRVLSHEVVASWLPRLSASYHQFGTVETSRAGPGVIRGQRRGMPRMFLHVWGTTATEVIERILARCGAEAPRVHVLEPEPDGRVSDYEVFRVPFEVRWTPKGAKSG
jgi:hypothetical protein